MEAEAEAEVERWLRDWEGRTSTHPSARGPAEEELDQHLQHRPYQCLDLGEAQHLKGSILLPVIFRTPKLQYPHISTIQICLDPHHLSRCKTTP